MTTTRLEEIKWWWDRAKENKAKYLVVMCDTYDYEDYPVECKTAEEARLRRDCPGDMQRVMEVYDMSKPFRTTRTFDPIKD